MTEGLDQSLFSSYITSQDYNAFEKDNYSFGSNMRSQKVMQREFESKVLIWLFTLLNFTKGVTLLTQNLMRNEIYTLRTDNISCKIQIRFK
jgi:hypothetical protein